MAENTLYYGDNLDILRRYVGDESVDLIYHCAARVAAVDGLSAPSLVPDP